MSLINDALKRLKKNNDGDAGNPPPLPPMDGLDPAGGEGKVKPARLALLVVLAGVLVYAIWSLGSMMLSKPEKLAEAAAPKNTQKNVAAATNETDTAEAPAEDAAGDIAEAPAEDDGEDVAEGEAGEGSDEASEATLAADETGQSDAPAESLEDPVENSPAVADALEPSTASDVVAETADSPDSAPVEPRVVDMGLKLQSIFYRPSRPAALINGSTVYAGDSVDGATVLTVGQSEVTVAMGGVTNTLAFKQ